MYELGEEFVGENLEANKVSAKRLHDGQWILCRSLSRVVNEKVK